MKKQPNDRKLRLDRQTIQCVTPAAMEQVHGGVWSITCLPPPPTTSVKTR